MMNNNNPFSDFTKSFMNTESMFGSMKQFPAMDFSSFTGMVKKNAEILNAANQIAAESAQSIVKRITEVCQNNASHMFDTVKDMSSSGDLDQATAHHQSYLKSSVENTMNNTKEMMDMVSKSSMEIFEVVGKSVSENVQKAFHKDKK